MTSVMTGLRSLVRRTTTRPAPAAAQNPGAVADVMAADNEVRAAILNWKMSDELDAHPRRLDHRYDQRAREFVPAVCAPHLCNEIDCGVSVRVLPDGRAVCNFGFHRTSTFTLLTAEATAIRVCLATQATDGPKSSRIELDLRDQDYEGPEEHRYLMHLTADEAEELAEALTYRVEKLRCLQQAGELAEKFAASEQGSCEVAHL
jgi:hypothetical protein